MLLFHSEIITGLLSKETDLEEVKNKQGQTPKEAGKSLKLWKQNVY
jgi:hypothetical protein